MSVPSAPVWAAFLCGLMLSGCPSDPPPVHVDIVTDLVPLVEFDAIRLDVGAGLSALRSDHIPSRGADYLQGVRLASVEPGVGATLIRISLFQDGVVVLDKSVIVEVGENAQAVTVVLSRSCRGVECPGTGNALLDTCLGGRCVDPRCTPESPDLCPVPACTADDQCAAQVSECAAPFCSSGVCFARVAGSLCGAGEYCDGTEGCSPDPTQTETDAGLLDMFVGADAGPDAPDLALTDGGDDAGDAGVVDAGPAPTAATAIYPWNGWMSGSALATGTLTHHPLRPKLMWYEVGDADYYQVQMTRECGSDFRSCEFTALELDVTTGGNSFRPATSLPVSLTQPVGDRYFWRVRACNAAAFCSGWTTIRYLDVGRTESDFNGDGYADTLVGDPHRAAPTNGEGTVFLYRGGAGGASMIGSAYNNPDGQENGWFGTSVAGVGDVNGDGYSDLLAGAPLHDTPFINEGSAYLYYGGPLGPAGTPTATFENPTNTIDCFFGQVLAAAGDVNADGYADFVITAPSQDDPERDEGGAYVYFGSPTGPSATPDISIDNPEDDIRAQFGVAATGVGDVNGDGYTDILIGAWHATTAHEGRAYLFNGGPSGTASSPRLTIDSPTGEPSGYFGLAVAGGADLNGDGYGDIAISAPNQDQGATHNAGATYVYFGPRIRTPDVTLLNPSAGVSGNFGRALGMGDINGDGFADLFVGAPGQDNPEVREGMTFVYFGSESGPPVLPSVPIDNPIDEGGGRFGDVVQAAGDVNGDGYLDLIVGSGQAAAYIFFGGETVVETPSQSFSGAGSFGFSVASSVEERFPELNQCFASASGRVWSHAPS